jgi:putative ABC transport system substrate-binding protein
MNRRRRLLLGALAASPLAAARAASAQRERPYRIGVLLPHSGRGGNMNLFYKAMADLGYAEGANLVIERRYAEGRDDRYAALAAELVGMPVDVLVAAGPSASRAARDASRTVPIVVGTIDPVEQGLIASLARPGGNVTGWTMLTVESAEKELSLLKEAMPRLSHVAVLANPRMPAHPGVVERLAEAARKMNARSTPVEVAGPESLATAFATMARDRVEAFVAIADPVVLDRGIQDVARLAIQHRLPGIYSWRSFADAGGLMSYGPSLPQLVASWATYVDKILKGAKPADIPVETPRKYELVLNRRVARELGFSFPAALLLAADAVID